MSADFSYLCRLCLKRSEFKFSLFIGNIPHKIQSLTSIQIEEDDKLPKTCCETCVANVYTAYKFQQCIIKSDKKLRENYNESHIIEQAKQTPDLFEVLHTEGASESPYIEPKSEIMEDVKDCDYVELNYKVEETEVSLDHHDSNNISDSYVLNNLLETTSNVGDDQKNSEELCNESYTEYIDIGGSVEKQDIQEYVKDLKDVQSENWHEKELQSFKEEQKVHNPNKSDAENIFTKLGIQNKFQQKYAAYREKQKNDKAIIECTDCDMKFDSKRMLQRHMMKHKIDKCPFCSITMRSDNLKRHIQIHTDSPEVCEICGKIAKNKESLRGHVNYQHKNSETFKCDACNREFKSNHHYKTHINKIHLGIRNHQCHICGKKFFANHDLKKHINMTHRGARPYVCQYCKKGFSSPYARKTHIRQHTLETPYRCDICSAGFRQKVSLVTHLKSKHAADKDKLKSEDD